MSIHTFDVNDNPNGFGQSYNQLAEMYRSQVKMRHYKNAKETEEWMKHKDKELAKEGEP